MSIHDGYSLGYKKVRNLKKFSENINEIISILSGLSFRDLYSLEQLV